MQTDEFKESFAEVIQERAAGLKTHCTAADCSGFRYNTLVLRIWAGNSIDPFSPEIGDIKAEAVGTIFIRTTTVIVCLDLTFGQAARLKLPAHNKATYHYSDPDLISAIDAVIEHLRSI